MGRGEDEKQMEEILRYDLNQKEYIKGKIFQV